MERFTASSAEFLYLHRNDFLGKPFVYLHFGRLFFQPGDRYGVML